MAVQAQRNQELERAQPEKKNFVTRFFTGGKSISKIERRSSDSDLLRIDKTQPSAPVLNYLNFETPQEESSESLRPFNLAKSITDEKIGKDESVSYISDLINQTALMSTQNSFMTRTIMKTNEKEEVGYVTSMKDIRVEDVHGFLSKYIPDSKQSAAHQIPKDLRKALGEVLDIPADQSLINYYEGDNSTGPNQRFIQDMKKYVLSARDFNVISVIQSHKLSSTSEFSYKNCFEMLAKCKQEISIFDSQITNKNSLQIKKAILSNIGPLVFRSFIDKRYADLIQSDFCDIKEMFDYIKVGLNDYSHFIRLSEEIPKVVGLSINSSKATTGSTGESSEKKNTKKPEKVTEEEKSPTPCWNCDGNHKLSKCPEKCRVHNKTNCDNIFNCLRNDRSVKRKDSKKDEKACVVCIESNGRQCSNIYDPGASATASHKVDLFNKDSIEYSNTPNVVEVGNGATIDIVGKGKIGDKDVFFVPDLNKTVIATDTTLADGRINVLSGNKLLVLKNDIRLINLLIEIEEIASEENLIVVELERQDGLYPMNDEQAKKLCTKDNLYTDNLDEISNRLGSDNYCNNYTNVLNDSSSILKSCFKSIKSTKSKTVTWNTDHSYRSDAKEYLNDTDNNKECPLKCYSSYFTVNNSKLADEMLFWHKNWNHISKKDMISVVKERIYKNMPKSLTVENINNHLPICESCPMGNMRAKPVPQKSMRVYGPGEYCVGDTKYMTEPDINGNIYLTVFSDRGSDKSFVYLHKKLDNLIDLVKDVNNKYKSAGHSMQTLGMDVQFLTKEISEYLKRANLDFENIEQEFPAPYEHAQNGKAENLIQKLENEVIKVLADSKAPKSFWGPIVLNAVKIRNTLPSKRNPSKSRNEMWGLGKGDLLNTPMIPFGSRVFAHIAAKSQAPLDFKCIETISLGWADGVKGGIILRNLVTNKNIVRRTFKVLGPGSSSLYNSSYDVNIEIDEIEDDIEDLNVEELDRSTKHDRNYLDLNRNSAELNNKNKHYFNYLKSTFYDQFDKSYWKVVSVVKENKASGPGSKTLYYKYYDIEKYPGGPPSDDGYEYTPCAELLRDKHIEWDDISNKNEVKVNTLVSMGCALRVYRVDFKHEMDEPPPKSIAEARNHPEQGYFKAFLKEIDGFHKRRADIPADIDIKDIDPNLILQLIPLFQKKYSGTNFEKFKCRMVVLGQHWKNPDNIDTTATMVGMETLKLILALGASLDMDMAKFDIKEAYLSTIVGPEEMYYTRRPPGVRNNEMPYIMKPYCFIYGHPLANKKFRLLLISILIKMGAKPSNYDPNLFVLDNIYGRALIPTIVDDMPTMYSGGEKMLSFLKEGLSDIFEITCDDPITAVLGMELSRDRSARKLTLRQRGAQYNLFNRVIPTWEADDIDSFQKIPKNPNGPLSEKNKKLKEIILDAKDVKNFQSIVGELNWINNTAPDFIFSTRCSARQMKSPNAYDMKELIQVVSCMAGVVRQNKDGLIIGGDIDLMFTTDTSYHGFEDLKSCTGGTMHLNHETGSISSFCEKHTITADSAMAAEGIGSHLHIKKALPIIYLFEELGYNLEHPAAFYMDNIPFMQTITGEKGPSNKSKHMLIRLQVTKEAFEGGKIRLQHLRSENMVADILTKALPFDKWDKLRDPLLGRTPIVLNIEEDNILGK
jgi:hypothetical protein